MEDRFRKPNIAVLRNVRSPLTEREVATLLATRTHRRSWMLFGPFLILVAALVVLPLSGNKHEELQRSSVAPKYRTARETTSLSIAATHSIRRVGGGLRDRPQYTRNEDAANVRVTLMSLDEPVLEIEPIRMQPVPDGPLREGTLSMSDPRPITVNAAFRPRPVIVSLHADLLRFGSGNVQLEYGLSDHLLIGVTTGIVARTEIASMAAVRFHDTTIASNGDEYRSTLGELVPRSVTRYQADVGASLRYLLNNSESTWNMFATSSTHYSGDRLRVALGAGAETYCLRNYWVSVSASTDLQGFVSVDVGLEAHW